MMLMVSIVAAMPFMAARDATASTYYVDAARPDDTGDGLSWADAKQTIQAAIGTSAAGDTILVKYGAYSTAGAIILDSTRLLTSDDGTHDSWNSASPDSSLCILAPSIVSRVLTVNNASVTSETRLRGFKITGGNATSETVGNKCGGGIYVAGGASMIIERCWISANRATTSSNGYGGGVACRNAGASVEIMNCLIEDNFGSTGYVGLGGGVYFQDAAPCRVHDNVIRNNMASSARIGSGGGISTDNTDLLVWSNTISFNVASGPSAVGGDGGGIDIYHGTVKIWDNVITYNHACERSGYGGDGGGIYISGTTFGDSILIFDNPAISYNIGGTAGAGNGGGICCAGPNVWMYGNTIEGNVATSSTNATASNRVGRGGGVKMTSSGGNTLRDNVIVNNTASLNGIGYGGGLWFESNQTIRRNIFAFNVASASDEEGYGGACCFSGLESGVIANNTIYRNANVTSALAIGAGSGMYHASAGNPTVTNNIVAGHDVANSDGMGFYSADAYTISYNCFSGNSGGNYNVNVTSNEEVLTDPRLADPAGGDFSLSYDSPCIEEGDPAFAVPENGGWVVDIGAIEYTGTRHRRPVAGTGELLFGGQVKAKVNVTTLGTLSEIDMVVHPGETHPMAPVSVARWYDIDHVGEGMEFDLTLSYLQEEVGARAEDSLGVWRWTGSGWDGPKAYSSRDLAKNWIAVSGQTAFSDWILTDDWGPTGVDEMPGRFHLAANYPNPFNPTTMIVYELACATHVRLVVYDAAGRLVKTLVDSRKGAGSHRVTWDGSDRLNRKVASGVYFCRLDAGAFVETRKMVLLR